MYLYMKLKKELLKKPMWKNKELNKMLGLKFKIKKEEKKYIFKDLKKLGINIKKKRLHRYTVFIVNERGEGNGKK